MRRHGWMILEMLVVVGLVAFVGLVSMQLFRATLRTWKDSADEQTAESRFDQAMGQLRRDVWSANSIDVRNSASVEIHNSAEAVHWIANPSAGLSRVGDKLADMRQWPGLGRMTFEVRGPALIVHLAPTHEEAGGQMVLLSQSILLAGRSR